MKIEVRTVILKEGLKKIGKLKVTNDKQMPILDNILLKANQHDLILID